MKNNEQAPRINTEDEKNRAEQRKRQEWGDKIAQEFGIDYVGEFFEIPHYNESGEEVRRTHVHAWDKIPFWSEDGKTIVESAEIKDVIRAILKHPDVELRAAIKLIKQEDKLSKNM